MEFLSQRKLREEIKREIENSSSGKTNLYPFWPVQGHQGYKLFTFWDISAKYDWRHNWMIENQVKIFSTINAIGTFMVGFKIRGFLGLLKRDVAKFNTLLPAFAFASIMGTTFHYLFVSIPMISNPLANHNSLIATSGLIHVATSVIYPIVFITGTSIYFSLRYNTFPIPDDLFKSKESRRYIMDNIIKKMMQKNRKSFAIFTMVNMVAASAATYVESQQTKKLFLMELAKHTKNSSNNNSG